MIEFMLLPFLTTIVLTGIHVYLGLHVIARGIIFIDISLAQIAALGALIGYVLGFNLHTIENYAVSLAFSVIAGVVFSFLKVEKFKVPLEAIIGITYVFSIALSILIMDRFPEGTEHIKYMLQGNILTVRSYEFIKMSIIYTIIGIVFYFIHEKLYKVSAGEISQMKSNINVNFYNLIFYTLFAVVVTSSVEIAGVLLVFSYLVIPQVAGLFLFSNSSHFKRLIFGWIFGSVLSFLGMILSYKFDMPTSPLIIILFVSCASIIGVLKYSFIK